MRLVAQLKGPPDPQGIRWLVLETDEKGSGGVFIFLHQSLEEGYDFDHWYEDIERAMEFAEEDWGVTKADWKPEE